MTAVYTVINIVSNNLNDHEIRLRPIQLSRNPNEPIQDEFSSFAAYYSMI